LLFSAWPTPGSPFGRNTCPSSQIAPPQLRGSRRPRGAPTSPTMAQPEPDQTTDKKRVKVYELRNGDWFDRGTGFCTAEFVTVCRVPPSRARADRHRPRRIKVFRWRYAGLQALAGYPFVETRLLTCFPDRGGTARTGTARNRRSRRFAWQMAAGDQNS
jgi:hypothetical protein